MKLKGIFLSLSLLALAACGKDSRQTGPSEHAVAAAPSSEALPSYETWGVISSLDGQILTLDHEGASAAGLKPGRDRFKVYADVLAEAPIAPGSRVRFAFKKTPNGLEVSKLQPRP